MPRFEDFDVHELRVITEAMEWSQSEFLDPGHTKGDRDTLAGLIKEAKSAEPERHTPDPGLWQWEATPRSTEDVGNIYDIAAPQHYAEIAKDKALVGGYDRGGHPIIRRPDGSTERVADKRPTRGTDDRQQRRPGEYTGFLYIECAHCEHVHAFCAKRPMRTYRCEVCGERTPLIDMYPMHVACECGARFNYLTNIVTQRMDVTCYHCGAPVAMEWSDKWRKFQPITHPPAKGRRKKGGRK